MCYGCPEGCAASGRGRQTNLTRRVTHQRQALHDPGRGRATVETPRTAAWCGCVGPHTSVMPKRPSHSVRSPCYQLTPEITSVV